MDLQLTLEDIPVAPKKYCRTMEHTAHLPNMFTGSIQEAFTISNTLLEE